MSAFNSQGSLSSSPQAGLLGNPKQTPGILGGSVSIAGAPKTPPGQLTSGVINLGQGSATDNAVAKGGTYPGLLQPTTPVKKTTFTNADGSVITQEHHAPDTTAPDDPGHMYNTQTGEKNPNYKDPNAPTPSSPTPAPQPAPLTTAGQIPGVLNSGQQTPNEQQTYTGLYNSANQADDPNSRISQAYQAKQDLENSYAAQQKAIQGAPIPLEFQQGRGQVLANQFGTQEQAAQTGISNALAGQGQQIAGLIGANTAAQTQAGRGAQTAESALGAVAPVDQFGVKINPTTGQPIGGGNFSDLATQGGTIQGLQSGAAAAAAAGGNITAQQETQQAGYKSAHQQATNLSSQLGDLITTFGLNPNDVNAANAGIQKIAQNISDPRYKLLSNYLSDIASRYAQILTPTGGSQTDTVRAQAQSMLDETASGQSIQQVIQGLDNQAQAVIAGVPTTGGNTNTSAGSTNSVSGFGWNP